MEGVQIVRKDKFFNFTKGRIITLDYLLITGSGDLTSLFL
jgi:hypothetical protein